METLVLTECPRDAMQGIKEFIPTELKIKYLNALLEVGFDRLDFGSFVSPKAIPQLQDTPKIMEHLISSRTKLLAIIANERGAADAVKFNQITFLGYPFSVSETFQQRNTNASIKDSLERVKVLQELCVKNNKSLLVYLSMAFGNPYGDSYSPEIVLNWASELHNLGVKHIALADTIGVAEPESIQNLFKHLIPAYTDVEFIAHLHSTPQSALEKIAAAYDSGCRNFDMAIHGFGGCPMATDSLTGNIATENILEFMLERNISSKFNHSKFANAALIANEVFASIEH